MQTLRHCEHRIQAITGGYWSCIARGTGTKEALAQTDRAVWCGNAASLSGLITGNNAVHGAIQ